MMTYSVQSIPYSAAHARHEQTLTVDIAALQLVGTTVLLSINIDEHRQRTAEGTYFMTCYSTLSGAAWRRGDRSAPAASRHAATASVRLPVLMKQEGRIQGVLSTFKSAAWRRGDRSAPAASRQVATASGSVSATLRSSTSAFALWPSNSCRASYSTAPGCDSTVLSLRMTRTVVMMFAQASTLAAEIEVGVATHSVATQPVSCIVWIPHRR